MLIRTSEAAHQVLPLAAFAVRCPCGYGHDSAASTPEGAVKEIRAQHDCGDVTLTATAYTCREHQTTKKRCRECER